MKLPNKIFTYQESSISKFPIVINIIAQYGNISISDLYNNTNRYFGDITEFFETIECLYALGKITYNFELRKINNVI
jgi:hypothetical protein